MTTNANLKNHRDDDDVLVCPCQEFSSLPKLLECMDSKERWERLIEWIDGATDRAACEQGKRLSCGKRSKCRFRFGLSFLILNAIRDAAKPFFEESENNLPPANSKSMERVPEKYEDAFPSLGKTQTGFSSSSGSGFDKPKLAQSSSASTNLLVPRKKPKEGSKNKKAGVSKSIGVWGSQQSTASSSDKANTLSLSATESTSTSAHTAPQVKSHEGSRKTSPPTTSLITSSKNGQAQAMKETPVQQFVVSPAKKQKRRIRPQVATMPSVPSSSVWGSASNTLESSFEFGTIHGNIATLPSQEPLTPLKTKHVNVVTSKPIEINASTKAITPSKDPSPSSSITASNSTPQNSKEQSPQRIVQPSKIEHVECLIEIYIILIKRCLVPSTIMELHLLVRLLIVSSRAECEKNHPFTPSYGTDVDAAVSFAPILASAERCLYFVMSSLRKLQRVLENMAVPVITALLRCEPFRKNLPESSRKLQLAFDDYVSKGVHAEYRPDEVVGSHAILSLPFDESRDSRKNYKTQLELAIYKSREDSRDAFLYQLRTFMNIRGKVLSTQDADRAIARIKTESQNIVSSLSEGNVVWFADFFVELLLQIGLAPAEETDEDILEIADKEKLQKLHRRFSSRSSNTSKSAKKVVFKKSKSNPLSSFTEEVKQKFVGHQEFFFIFVQSAGSFSFSMHLRSKLAALLLELSKNNQPEGIEKRILDTQLLAKFLGYLVFSPNWRSGQAESTGLDTPSTMDGMKQLYSLDINLGVLLSDAWNQSTLISFIPWVVELLYMARWDLWSQRSTDFRQLHGSLRMIQCLLGSSDVDDYRFGPTKQLLSCFLENYFHDVLGLSKMTSLPPALKQFSTKVDRDASALDTLPLGFSTVILFSSDPHIEDFMSLIARNRSALHQSPSKTRKLRPSVVSSGIGFEMRKLFDDSSIDGASFSTAPEWSSPVKDPPLPNIVSANKNATIQTKLVDAFFHQHRELKEVCEFVVNRVLKNISNSIVSHCIKPTYERLQGKIESAEALLSLILKEVNEYFYTTLESSLRQSLRVLGPCEISDRVVETATKLAIARGQQLGQPIISSIVVAEVDIIKSLLSKGMKYGSEQVTCVTLLETGDFDLDRLNKSLKRLNNLLADNSDDTKEIANQIYETHVSMNEWTRSSADRIQNESLLRTLFEASFKIDQQSPSFLAKWNMKQCGTGCLLIHQYLSLLCGLSVHSQSGFRCTCKVLSEDSFLLKFLRNALNRKSTTGLSEERISDLFIQLVHHRFIRMGSLVEICFPSEGCGSRVGEFDESSCFEQFCRHTVEMADSSLGWTLEEGPRA